MASNPKKVFHALETEAKKLLGLRALDEEQAKELKAALARSERALSSHRPYVVGVAGQSSAGKTTLLDALFGDYGLSGVDLPIGETTTTYVPTTIRLKRGALTSPECFAEPHEPDDVLRALTVTVNGILQRQKGRTLPDNPSLDELDRALKRVDQTRLDTDGQATFKQCKQAAERIKAGDSSGAARSDRESVSADRARDIIGAEESMYQYRQVMIDLCHPDLPHAIDIVDLPGFDVSTTLHRHFTYDFVTYADGLLLVKPVARFTFTPAENQFWAELMQHFGAMHANKMLLFIVNGYADLKRDAKLDDKIRAKAAELHIKDHHLHKTSALYARILKAALRDDTGLDKAIERYKETGATGAHLRELASRHGGVDGVLRHIGFSDLEEAITGFLFHELPDAKQREEESELRSLHSTMTAYANRALTKMDPDMQSPVLDARSSLDKEMQAKYRLAMYQLAREFGSVQSGCMEAALDVGQQPSSLGAEAKVEV